MKTLHLSIVIAAGIATVIIFVMIDYFELETKPHTKMKTIGLNDIYSVYQIMRFQVYAEGYGYSCVGTPEIVIYKTNQQSIIVYHEKSKIFMCPVTPLMSFFSVYYPNQSDYYTTAIEQEGNYTLHVSYRDAEIEKMFMVKTK